MNNYHSIFEELSGIRGEISDDFGRIVVQVVERNQAINRELDEKRLTPKQVSRRISTALEKEVDRLVADMNLNLFPSDSKGKCQELCICKAFGKWNSRKNGFKGSAEYLVNHYFKSCGKVNHRILILTSAWDEVDFYELFKEKFDDYCYSGHRIVVIQITSSNISIQFKR